jgi:3'(2'), 5'-bisphosphate nucleotidase
MSAPSQQDLADRLEFAKAIAGAAGRRLLGLRTEGRWSEPKLLGDIGDQAADGYLQGAVFGRYPDDAILSEETKGVPGRTEKRGVWIVDPLDGTKEYSTGRHDWAVHVGFAWDGVPLLGAVALPAIDRVLTAAGGVAKLHAGGGAADWPSEFVCDRGPAAETSPRLVVSRSHTPDWIQRFADGLGGKDLVPCGSVGFKVAMLLFGRADVYVHKTGLKEWDTCAPEAIARAAGFAVCRFDGQTQRYNQKDPRNDEIVVCRPWLQDRVLQALRAAKPE